MRAEENTPAETPKAKARLSMHQTVRLVDILEAFAKQFNDINKQIAYILIKRDNANPVVYNRIVEDKRREVDLLIDDFKDSLEEPEDRTSQSIIVNVNAKKSESPPNKILVNKVTTIVSVTTAIITGIILALREIFK